MSSVPLWTPHCEVVATFSAPARYHTLHTYILAFSAFTMQFKNNDDPRQGSLPPGVAEGPSTPRHEQTPAPRRHPRLRHRCPFGCAHTHSQAESQHTHHSNNEPSQGTPTTPTQHPQPQSRPTGSATVFVNQHHHHHHHNPYYRTAPSHQHQHHQQAVPSSNINMTSRGVSEWRVPPPLSHQTTAATYLPQPFIPVDFRRRAIQYM